MKKKRIIPAVLCSVLTLSVFVFSSAAPAKDISKIKKVAIVSLSVSDVGGSVRGGSIGSTPVSKLIKATVNDMLHDAEKKLSSKWKVVKASGFSSNAAYRKPAVPKTLTVYVPTIKGKEMPVFTQVSREIKGGVIAPEKARALCKALQVDAVVVIFSEWAAKTGGFIPTTKALAKNILAVWDGNGRKVFKKRVDIVGKKTLGVSGIKAVNDKTIGEWRDAYNRGLDKIIHSM